MAKCEWCEQEMTDPAVITCTGNTEVEYPDGEKLPAVPYRNEYREKQGETNYRCGDCGILVGNFHHPGCDMDQCPRCDGRLIGCGCLDEDEEDEGEE